MKYDKQTVAVAYPLDKTGWKNPFSHQNMNRSSETESINTMTFRQRALLHAGMNRKPLQAYNPTAHRSRLPVPTVVMPYKNSSQIVIGDRSTNNKKHFKTGNMLKYVKHDTRDGETNPGILARKNSWVHKM